MSYLFIVGIWYHGVSEKDIAEKNERYRGLLTSLTD